MCICFIRCGIKVTLFTIHMQTPKAYFMPRTIMVHFRCYSLINHRKHFGMPPSLLMIRKRY